MQQHNDKHWANIWPQYFAGSLCHKCPQTRRGWYVIQGVGSICGLANGAIGPSWLVLTRGQNNIYASRYQHPQQCSIVMIYQDIIPMRACSVLISVPPSRCSRHTKSINIRLCYACFFGLNSQSNIIYWHQVMKTRQWAGHHRFK